MVNVLEDAICLSFTIHLVHELRCLPTTLFAFKDVF